VRISVFEATGGREYIYRSLSKYFTRVGG